MTGQIEASYLDADRSTDLADITVGALLRLAAELSPTSDAVVDGSNGSKRMTYRELFETSETTARALLCRVPTGSRIAIWAPNVVEWLILEYAAALAGVTVVTVNPAYRHHEVQYILSKTKSSLLFHGGSYRGSDMRAMATSLKHECPHLEDTFALVELDRFADMAESGALPPVPTDAVAQIQFTSGTTGVPKGAMLHHLGITNNARFWIQRMNIGNEGAILGMLPMFHTGGSCCSALSALWTRSLLVMVRDYDPGHFLSLIESEGISMMAGVPTMFIDMLDHPEFSHHDVTSVRNISPGGSTVAPGLIRRLQDAFGATVTNAFGQTEASPIITMTHPTDSPEDISMSVGVPLPQAEVRIVASDGEVAPRGVVGELQVRGYQVMAGYWDMQSESGNTITPDGWLRTGDLLSMDERGYLYVKGRLKEMIIRGGENVYPREIEEVILGHPDVADVAVIGVPNSRYGEAVVAFIRARPDTECDGHSLAEFTGERLARHKVPREWIFVDHFPLTASGKIRKTELLEQWKRDHATGDQTE